MQSGLEDERREYVQDAFTETCSLLLLGIRSRHASARGDNGSSLTKGYHTERTSERIRHGKRSRLTECLGSILRPPELIKPSDSARSALESCSHSTSGRRLEEPWNPRVPC